MVRSGSSSGGGSCSSISGMGILPFWSYPLSFPEFSKLISQQPLFSETSWMLKLNQWKYKVLHLNPNNPCHSCYMVDSAGANMPIQSVKEECDLG